MLKEPKNGQTINWNYLLFTLFSTGAAILVLEVLGARLLSPYFGVGLFVWSSLITVTLTALALGYWFGGNLADRSPYPRTLYFLILLAGIYVLFIPLVASFLIQVFSRLGVRFGSLIAGLVLFGPPMFTLGMISPFAVKLYTPDINVLGRRVGHLYAVSTVGSCFGSLLTGFILVPIMSVHSIFFLVSFSLFTLWAIQVFVEKRKMRKIALLAPLISLGFLAFTPNHISAKKSGHVLYDANSLYGHLRVEERGEKRWLLIDGAPNSGINKRTGFALFPYTYYFEILPFINPKAKNALLIGLGGGSISKRLSDWGLDVDSVEIDKDVVKVARKYFGYVDRRGNVYTKDAREFVHSCDKTYDFIVMDVFTGDLAPIHLFSKEAFTETQRILSENGVLGINYIGFPKGDKARVTRSIVKTLKSVFPHVKMFTRKETSDEIGNIIFLASRNDLSLKKKVRTHPIPEIRRILKEMITHEKECEVGEDAIILTDNYNPIQVWNLEAALAWRQLIWKTY